MEQTKDEWICLGVVTVSKISQRPSTFVASLYVKLVFGEKCYAIKYEGWYYRVAPDKDGNVRVRIGDNYYEFTLVSTKIN